MIKKCSKCGKDFEGKTRSDSYCKECKKDFMRLEKVKKSQKEFEGANPDAFVVCQICGLHSGNIASHLRKTHDMSCEDYQKTYNQPVISKKLLEEMSQRIKGSNNPAYQHGGKFSPFSKKFIKGDISEQTFEKAKNSREENCGYTTRLDYYTSRGYSEEEAQKALSERQTTFSKEICVEKYGEEEGLKVWKERQDKWLDSYYDKSLEELENIQIYKNSSFDYIKSYFNLSEEETLKMLKEIDKEDFKKYSNKVSYHSDKIYQKYKDEIDPNDLRGVKCGYNIDHKFSRLIGFLENIPYEVISCKGNLELMKYDENFSKHCRCSITKEELYESYKKEL